MASQTSSSSNLPESTNSVSDNPSSGNLLVVAQSSELATTSVNLPNFSVRDNFDLLRSKMAFELLHPETVSPAIITCTTTIQSGAGCEAKEMAVKLPLVHGILAIQFILIVVVTTPFVLMPHIGHFFYTTEVGLWIYLGCLFLTSVGLSLLFIYKKNRPTNIILITISSCGVAFMVGFSSSSKQGAIILEAIILTMVIVIGLIIYTIVVRKAQDSGFFQQFFFCSFLSFSLSFIIQINFPLGDLYLMVFSYLFSLGFGAYIIYNTKKLVMTFQYHEHIEAAAALYMSIIGFCVSIVGVISIIQSTTSRR